MALNQECWSHIIAIAFGITLKTFLSYGVFVVLLFLLSVNSKTFYPSFVFLLVASVWGGYIKFVVYIFPYFYSMQEGAVNNLGRFMFVQGSIGNAIDYNAAEKIREVVCLRWRLFQDKRTGWTCKSTLAAVSEGLIPRGADLFYIFHSLLFNNTYTCRPTSAGNE